MSKFEYIIPIQDDEQCEKFNKEFGTDFKGTDWHINNLIDKVFEEVCRVGEENGWYVNDDIKVKVEISYEPEDK